MHVDCTELHALIALPSGEYDFITYFECAADALPIFDQICKALRDPLQNPEWRYVEEGPMWRGRRVLRW